MIKRKIRGEWGLQDRDEWRMIEMRGGNLSWKPRLFKSDDGYDDDDDEFLRGRNLARLEKNAKG